MIEISNLVKKYGSNIAVNNISFNVNPGEIVGFLGPNGAGKTTTMNILTGYLSSTQGSAKIDGIDIEAGVKRFGGKTDRYYKALRAYAMGLEEDDRPMDDVLSQKNAEESAAKIHTIKGVTGNMGAVALYEAMNDKTIRGKVVLNSVSLIERDSARRI